MNRIRLFHTSAFRLSLLYAALYSLLSAAGFAIIYWATASHIEAQIDARLRLETEFLLALYHDRALPALVEAVRQRNRDDGQRKIFFYRLLRANDQWPPELSMSDSVSKQSRMYTTIPLQNVFILGSDQYNGDAQVRVLATQLPNGQQLLVGRDLIDEQQLLDHILAVGTGVITATILLVIFGSLLLGYKNLRRIDAISYTAGEIIAGDLSRRIVLGKGDDEFDMLGRKLNAMLERIEQLMTGMREVTDNIAHDLRSPLNRLRNRLEVTLLETRATEEYRRVITQAIEDTDSLLKTFNALLDITQAEAGINRDSWKTLNLSQLATDLADLYEVVAEEKGIDWVFSADSDITIQGNRQLLAQAVSNLLDNAVKYCPMGGRIELGMHYMNSTPEIYVADSGPGIPETDRQRVLERFVRLDNARSQTGNGLGLSLVRAAANLHRATLTLTDNNPGLRVTLRFRPEPARPN